MLWTMKGFTENDLRVEEQQSTQNPLRPYSDTVKCNGLQSWTLLWKALWWRMLLTALHIYKGDQEDVGDTFRVTKEITLKSLFSSFREFGEPLLLLPSVHCEDLRKWRANENSLAIGSQRFVFPEKWCLDSHPAVINFSHWVATSSIFILKIYPASYSSGAQFFNYLTLTVLG